MSAFDIAMGSITGEEPVGETSASEKRVLRTKPKAEGVDESRKKSSKQLQRKFNEIFELWDAMRNAKGKEKAELKKSFRDLYDALTEKEKQQYKKYKQELEVLSKDIRVIKDREGAKVKVSGKKVEAFKGLEEMKMKQFKAEREIMFQTDIPTEDSKMVEDVMSELDKALAFIPEKPVTLQTSYSPKEFQPIKFDIPGGYVTEQEKKRLSKEDQKALMIKRASMEPFERALKDGDEVEIRFGSQKKNYFDSQVSKDEFFTLQRWTANQKIEPYFVKTVVFSKKAERVFEPLLNKQGTPVIGKDGKPVMRSFNEHVRIIDENGQRKIEKKRTLATMTSPNLGARIQASRESGLDRSELTKYDLTSKDFIVRQKTRWSYKLSDHVYLDMTKVTDPRNRGDIRYEVEIELDDKYYQNPQAKKPFDNDIVYWILFIRSKMQNANAETVIFPQNVSVLINNYNSIFESMRMKEMMEKGTEVDNSKLFNPFKFFSLENKPQPFSFKNVSAGYDYRVTPKLDGLRVRIFIDKNGIFEVNPKTGYVSMIYKGEWAEENLAGTIIDTEYYRGEYYPFDVLAYKGENIIDFPFDQRIGKIVKVEQVKTSNNVWETRTVGLNLPNFNYTKPFYGAPFQNVYDSIKSALRWINEHDLEFDGLILQRNDEPYWQPPPKKTTTMKWKPLDEMTVDLLTMVTSDGQVQLFSVDPSVKGGAHEGLKIEHFTDYIPTIKDLGIPEDLAEEGDFIAEYGFIAEDPYIEYRNVRDDKTVPNFHKTVSSNKNLFFRSPVSEKDIVGQTLLTWRKWASSIKRDVVNGLIPQDARVLDIGVGRGGGALFDISRKAGKVYGIDPDDENLKELKRRLSESSFTDEQRSKIVTAKLKGQDTEEILSLLGKDTVDVITMFFSISFFFENEKELDKLMETIDQTAHRNKGSILIIQLMDGERVSQELKKAAEEKGKYVIGNEVYTIKTKFGKDKKKQQEFQESDDAIGVPITIKLPEEKDAIIGVGETRGKQSEWLSPVSVLNEKLEDIGFKVLSDDFMDKSSVLPSSNEEFARLYRSLVYIRKGGVSQLKNVPKTSFVEPVEIYLSPLPENESEDFKEWSRIGVRSDSSAFLASLLYHISKTYRNAVDNRQVRDRKIRELRATLAELIDEEMFSKLVSGNVKHNITFDLLHAKAYDTMKKGKQVDAVYNAKEAEKAAYDEYMERIKSGYVGYELSEAIGCLWDVRINIVDESGNIAYIGNENGKRKEIYILKIGTISFEPLV